MRRLKLLPQEGMSCKDLYYGRQKRGDFDPNIGVLKGYGRAMHRPVD